MQKQETILTQELDKLEDVGNAEAVYILYSALGDQFCASGALNQFYKQYNKKLYIISDKPSLFSQQDFCEASINYKVLSASGDSNFSNLFRNFKKIHTLFWQSESHLKGYTSIVENYCDQLKVSRVKYPFFKVKLNLNTNIKPYILVSLKNTSPIPFFNERTKYYSDKMSDCLIEKIKINFENYEVFDLKDLNVSSLHDLVEIVANCKSFVSVDTALQHLAANAFCQKKGIVLWNNKENIKIYGYETNINLYNESIHPYNNYDIILEKLNKFL